MRYLDLLDFDGPFDVSNFAPIILERLQEDLVCFPQQSVELVGRMAWPNDEEKMSHWRRVHLPHNAGVLNSSSQLLSETRGFWAADSKAIDEFSPELRKVQQHWSRVADVFHHLYDLDAGAHQKRRGGASVSKAIAIVDGGATSWGTKSASLWAHWGTYKDAAHLLTSTNIVTAEARTRFRNELKGELLSPYRIAMLLPDLVLSVAMKFETFGITHVSQSSDGPLLAADTAWRIPIKVKLAPIDPPVRKIGLSSLAVLSERRSGNRGQKKNQASGLLSE